MKTVYILASHEVFNDYDRARTLDPTLATFNEAAFIEESKKAGRDYTLEEFTIGCNKADTDKIFNPSLDFILIK